MCVCVGVGAERRTQDGGENIGRKRRRQELTDRRVGRERKTGRQMWGGE